MSRLVLHIGTHKTATTSVQKFLRRNDAALSKRGLWYPDYRLIGRSSHYAHLGVVNALSGRDRKTTPEDARRFFETVREKAATRPLTVISAESFWRHVDLPPEAETPVEPGAYWAARRSYIAKLRDLVGPARIVVTLRRQDQYAASLYQEHVKATRYAGDFAAFRAEHWWHFDYLAQIRAWAEVFPDPLVLRFEDLRAGGDVAGAFCAALGVDAGGLERPERMNEALLPDLVVVKRGLATVDVSRGTLRDRIEALEAAVEPEVRAVLARRSLWASASEADAFREGFAADNATLSSEFLDGAPLFDAAPADPELIYGDALHPEMLNWLSRRARPGGAP
ncbi:hypothetical protein [Jannaschia seohaensis]|uniref:Sulfotransferase family protein n=1 Tax=Jannaschia seohaensis TaxID=475081 RepID=A0A2Y9B3Y7_9RHOB|nr:hypothetical protein [Jannaschia seohaensis]PWJ12907.1 hypothetical protein BCF38_11543 [Jannaschia seohaensis]SSA50715.1 hypothetical protein SAMN05421539_11543 [Jannaschia seohaensis]